MKSTHSTPVGFFCAAPTATALFVAGTFNGWKPAADPLHSQDGRWTVTLPLSPGNHEYEFVVDGQWCGQPGCEAEYRGCDKCVPNECGTMNRVLEVG